MIISIANQKGGVGKTTTAINLSAYLALQGKKTLLIDLDPQGAATIGLGIDPWTLERTIYEVLIGKYKFGRVISTTQVNNLDLAPANIQLSGAELELAGQIGRETILRQRLKDLEYDYIIIDTPPNLGLLTVNSLAACSRLIIPLQTEYLPLVGTHLLFQVVDSVIERLGNKIDWKVLLTMLDKRRTTSKQILEKAGERFKDRVFNATIPKNSPLSDAPSFGVPICIYDPKCPGAIAYEELTKEVLQW